MGPLVKAIVTETENPNFGLSKMRFQPYFRKHFSNIGSKSDNIQKYHQVYARVRIFLAYFLFLV